MSGQIIGQIVGTVIGTMVGGPIGGAIGGGIGGSIGSSFDSLPTQYGPRLDDLRAQRSEYGYPIPIVYGTVALQGNVIWAQDIKEVQTETEQGGKGGPSQTAVTYSYYGSFAVAICEGPIGGVLRIWAGPSKRLIYDGVALEGGSVRIYLGTEDQMPDPLIEADKGVGFAPAYRGTAYVVLEDFPLAKDGNTLPFLTIEVTTGDDGGTCGTDYTIVGDSRLYDVPPVKLGNFGGDMNGIPQQMYASGGAHPTAVDNDGNIYVPVRGVGYVWYLKKVSTTSYHEDLLPLGDQFTSIFACSIAYDPNANMLGIIQEGTANFLLVDCSNFTATYLTADYDKCDIIYSENEQRFRMLDARTHWVEGKLSEDSYGIEDNYRFGGRLIECGPHGIFVNVRGEMSQNGVVLVRKEMDIYDPIRDRLIAVTGYLERFTGYYDFATGETVTPVDLGPGYRLNARYLPGIDRIAYNDGDGIVIMNPADFSTESFPDECKLFGGKLLYGDGSQVNNWGTTYYPVAIPRARNKLAVVTAGNWNNTNLGNDIFSFAVGVRGKGVTLASVVADLSKRAGESRYDVSQLESDIVDGYVIARQTTVRSAIDALRPAYYFDGVESQGLIKFVKRGSKEVTVVDDDDLGAHDFGSESPDPLETTRQMEVELPRAVNVKYMLANDDYNQAAKQARRLIGSSGDELTIDAPLVLTDTKGQEVAEVNLHARWGERLPYRFNLPRKYAANEPTDLMLVKGHLMRLTKVTDTPRGVRQCEAVSDESIYYSPHVVVTETPPREGTVPKPGVTLLELF